MNSHVEFKDVKNGELLEKEGESISTGKKTKKTMDRWQTQLLDLSNVDTEVKTSCVCNKKLEKRNVGKRCKISKRNECKRGSENDAVWK